MQHLPLLFFRTTTCVCIGICNGLQSLGWCNRKILIFDGGGCFFYFPLEKLILVKLICHFNNFLQKKIG